MILVLLVYLFGVIGLGLAFAVVWLFGSEEKSTQETRAWMRENPKATVSCVFLWPVAIPAVCLYKKKDN